MCSETLHIIDGKILYNRGHVINITLSLCSYQFALDAARDTVIMCDIALIVLVVF